MSTILVRQQKLGDLLIRHAPRNEIQCAARKFVAELPMLQFKLEALPLWDMLSLVALRMRPFNHSSFYSVEYKSSMT